MKQTIKIMTTVFAGLALTLGLTFTSCKKAEKGETGPAGANGTNGTNGTNGADGNATVYSYKFNVPISSFVGPLTNGAWQYVFNPSSVMGSTFIDEKDVILLYLFDHTTSGTDYYNQMPFLNYFNTGTAFNHHSYQLASTGPANIILIEIRNSTGGQPYTSMTTGTMSYKMVYIKASNKVAPTLPSNLDYASVKAYYKLQD